MRKNGTIMNGHERTIYILFIMGWNLPPEKRKLPSHELGCMAVSEDERERT